MLAEPPPGKAPRAAQDAPGDRPGLPIDRLPRAYLRLDAELRVLDWNAAAERLFGFSRQEAVGRSVFGLIVPVPPSEHLGAVLRQLRAGDMEAHSVNENRTRDG